MNEETIKDILMDIIINENTYIANEIIQDEEFCATRQLVLSHYTQYGATKRMILKYGYDNVNAVMAELMDFRNAMLNRKKDIDELIEELNTGYDADPEQAPKELERMCDLCARAADYLGELV